VTGLDVAEALALYSRCDRLGRTGAVHARRVVELLGTLLQPGPRRSP
jgi:hypothetical protein